MVSLDEYVRTHKISRVDLIKVDVEGAEMDVLIGAERTLRDKRPIVVVEFNTADAQKECERFLRSIGYACQEIGRSSYGVHIIATKEG